MNGFDVAGDYAFALSGIVLAAIALGALLRRAPQLALDPGRDVKWWTIAGVLGPETLPVRPTAARAARRAR